MHLTRITKLSLYLRRRTSAPRQAMLLHIDTAYSLETITDQKIGHIITRRDLDGFFEHVWSVHPSVGASPLHSPDSSVGSPTTYPISSRHTVVEGKVAQFRWLRFVPRLNFALAQTVLIVQLLRLIRRHKISIIRTSDPFYTGILGLILARPNRIPLIVCVNANHDHMYAATGEVAYPRLFPSRALEVRVARFVLKRADLIAAGNEDNRRCALANDGRAERSTVFRCGIWVDSVHFEMKPEQRTSLRSELGFEDRPFMIVVGRLEPVKHPDDVLAVLARSKIRHPDLAAVFVGDGSMRAELESSAAEMGLRDDVRFVGNRDQKWIANGLTSATVVLSPLSGRALVEACLSGTPVVAYDVEWHSELVSTGQTGVLIPYRAIDDMTDAVCALVGDPLMARKIGERARTATMEMMDPARLKDHERSEYLKLMHTHV